MKRLVVMLGVLCLSASSTEAQIVQAVTPASVPGESETEVAAKLAEDKSGKGAKVLTQGNIDSSSDGTKVGIQAADLWIHKYVRFYGRLTLPVTQNAKTTEPKSADTKADAVTEKKLSGAIRQQLVDPYGGLFNMSGGFFRSMYSFERKPEPKTEAEVPDLTGELDRATLTSMINGASSQRQFLIQKALVEKDVAKNGQAHASEAVTKTKAESEAIAKNVQPEHGIFADVRGGFKFLELPDPGESNPEVAGTKVNVFYTGIAGVKMIAPLYNAAPDAHGHFEPGHEAGGLTIGVYYVLNQAADTTQSSAFTTLLNKKTWAWTMVVGWDLPGTDVAALTFSATPRTSDTRLGKIFTFGLTLKNKDKQDKPATAPDGEKKQ